MTSLGNVWFTSDLHFGHARVAEYRGYPVDEHDLLLADNWRRVVKEEDQIWVLGDLSMSDYKYALEIIKALPGTKHLVAGNHDPVHSMHAQAHRFQREYLEVFDSVQIAARRSILKRDVLLSHFPYRKDHTGIPRYDQWRLRDEGRWLLHGHTHGKTRIYPGEVEIQVGVDAWDFKPVSINEIVRIMRDVDREYREKM